MSLLSRDAGGLALALAPDDEKRNPLLMEKKKKT